MPPPPPTNEPKRMPSSTELSFAIVEAKHQLDKARLGGDALKVDLAEAGLNSLLDQLDVTHVTRNNEDGSQHV